jgi:methionine-rich copper-binding protein CopC
MAHAVLASSDPGNQAVLAQAPDTVTLRFTFVVTAAAS